MKVFSKAKLFLRNGLRVSHVVASRQLGLRPRYLPIMLMFVTDRCNLRCKMCGVCELENSRAHEQELTTDEWKAVIDSAARLGVMIISISGGEPLLRRDVYELIAHAKSKGITVHMCTNGILINADRAQKLRESGVSTVSISVEGTDAAVHDRLRGAGTHAPALAAIRLLRETAPEIRIGINYLITRQNFRNMADMVAFAEGLGVDQLKFAPIHTNLLHRRKRIEEYNELLFSREDLEELEGELKKLGAACENTRLLTTSTTFFSGIASLYSEPRRFKCYAGYAAIAVNPTGGVAPCCDIEGGLNVRTEPLERIWRGAEFHKLRNRVRHCGASCWDTTNTELSLRLRPAGLLGELARNLRDLNFYFGGGN